VSPHLLEKEGHQLHVVCLDTGIEQNIKGDETGLVLQDPLLLLVHTFVSVIDCNE